MKLRLVTVWTDAEGNDDIQRAYKDFATTEEIDAHIAAVVSAGVTRIDLATTPMKNGTHLIAAFVQIRHIAGWYVWNLPDDTPSWPIVATQEATSNA